MAGLYEKPSETYAKKRPQYPKEWFSMLAGLTAGHQRAWDAGCGTGQAAIGMAEHYESVVATDVSEGQIQHAIAHPKVRYLQTPEHLSEDELVSWSAARAPWTWSGFSVSENQKNRRS
ncbi:hypothetical protein Zm00014a_039535 [Zea mays]|uniref:Methyltransferase domain-containing protein n=1 Tax=Zea mays TaxID=4577 RepID=A0A3L6FB09_MAIZE|nr:hypothetical protein Zm00014a_039535 [Zea mays]